MARSGLYKSDVKKARDALLAQGKHPSVDAVRVALGNTGSKTTIHKYLKELEEEEGSGTGRKSSISDALQDLVARLAAQLQAETEAQVDAIRAEQAEQARRHADALAAARQELDQWRNQAQHTETELRDEQTAHHRTRDALQKETIARHTADQQVADLKERLDENEAHRRSLEEKHKHAREALEHYRASMKEQREQDIRRHEQQIQQLQAELRVAQQTIVVKQEDVTRLNQEGARLVAELSHTRQTLHDAEERLRRQGVRLDALQEVEQRNEAMAKHIADKERHAADLQAQLTALTGRARGLEMSLAQAVAKAEAQQDIVAELRAFLDSREPPAPAPAN
jgi:chromosome segregation ATPase